MKSKTIILIKFIGLLLISASFLHIYLNAKGSWFTIKNFFSLNYLGLGLLGLLLHIVFPLLFILSGYFLFKLRTWGWGSSLILLTLLFIKKFSEAGYFAYAIIKFQNLPMPEISEGSVVEKISMWPVYITAFMCLVIIWVLTRKPIKEIIQDYKLINS